MWIRKPLASSQGRGIKVVSTKAVRRLAGLDKPVGGSVDSKKVQPPCVVQQYIDRPLLVGGYKFDMRVYVCVTGYNPLRAYMFPEGLARFCTDKYSRRNRRNVFSHLTNYSINKKSANFTVEGDGEDGVGSKWSLSALFRYLAKAHGEERAARVRADMQHVVVKTLIAADDDMNAAASAVTRHADCCFEVFGFDLLCDKDLRVWLVEVNISPSLMTASPLDRRVKTIMVSDALHLVGLPAPAPGDAASAVSSATGGSAAAAAGPAASANASAAATTTTGASAPRRQRSGLAPAAARAAQQQQHKLQQARAKAQAKEQRARERAAAARGAADLEQKTWAQLAPHDKRVVYNAVAEHGRRGHFERIFPPVHDAAQHETWSKLFSTQRYANALLKKFEKDAEKELARACKPDPPAPAGSA
jgi:hypothetical protein